MNTLYDDPVDAIRTQLAAIDRVDASLEDYLEALEEVLEEVRERVDATRADLGR